MFGAMPGSASPSSPNRRGAVEQRLDHEQAPAIADAVEGALERGRLGRRRSVGAESVTGRWYERSGLANALSQ